MLEIEQRYQDPAINMSRHDKLRVEQWSSLLCQVNPSPTWKRNRNLYTSLLLNEIVTHGKLDRSSCFVQKPPDNGGMLPTLSRTEVMSKLSKKYKRVVESFNASMIRERLLSADQLEMHDEIERTSQQ